MFVMTGLRDALINGILIKCSLSLSLECCMPVVDDRLFEAHNNHLSNSQSSTVCTETITEMSSLSSQTSDKRVTTGLLYEEINTRTPASAAVPVSLKSAANSREVQAAADQQETKHGVLLEQRKGCGQTMETKPSSSCAVVPGRDKPTDGQSNSTYQPDKTSSAPVAGPRTGRPPVINGRKTVSPPSPSQQATTAERKLEMKATNQPMADQKESTRPCPAVAPRNPRRHDRAPSKRESRPNLDLPSIDCSKPEIYVAEWKCVGGAANELSFQKGDRLLIVSRQYEHLGWLVAETCSSKMTGLVPKNYVTKAA